MPLTASPKSDVWALGLVISQFISENLPRIQELQSEIEDTLIEQAIVNETLRLLNLKNRTQDQELQCMDYLERLKISYSTMSEIAIWAAVFDKKMMLKKRPQSLFKEWNAQVKALPKPKPLNQLLNLEDLYVAMVQEKHDDRISLQDAKVGRYYHEELA